MYKNWKKPSTQSQLQVENETLTATYGKFCAEPFESGFGTILGNSLRRVSILVYSGHRYNLTADQRSVARILCNPRCHRGYRRDHIKSEICPV